MKQNFEPIPARKILHGPRVVYEKYEEEQQETAPRPYPMTKIESGYPWTM